MKTNSNRTKDAFTLTYLQQFGAVFNFFHRSASCFSSAYAAENAEMACVTTYLLAEVLCDFA